MSLVGRYLRWLHLRWPAGSVERLPVCDASGGTSVPGVFIVGDLAGIPLLKFALDTGTAAARRCAAELRSVHAGPEDVLDVVVLGAGVAGMAAAMECLALGLRIRVVEAATPFSTVANFPAGKPIFTYPTAMNPRGRLQVTAAVKEELLAELRATVEPHAIPLTLASAERVRREKDVLLVDLQDGEQLRARRVIVAIGRTGNFRRLGVPGEELPHVSNRLLDPAHHAGKPVVVVGGGDTAVEAAIALAEAGATVSLVHRGQELSRPKPDNVKRATKLAAAGRLSLRLGTRVVRVDDDAVTVSRGGVASQLPAPDAVFVLLGREPPLDFFRRSGIRIRGERSAWAWGGVAAFAATATLLYAMKAFGVFGTASWNPSHLAKVHLLELDATGAPRGLWYALVASASNGVGFFIALLYCVAVVAFGIDRMRRRRTPYVRAQTLVLMMLQVFPLFVLPEILLPWLGRHGAWDSGWLKTAADNLFPAASYDANGREYWRAYGFVLAWPLFVWNVFTAQPLGWWLVIGLVQTFVFIPLIVWRWGKGAYCGWLCSCGALAETMGDRHREKMPHGPGWNRLNGVGQIVLCAACLLLVLRVAAWATDWAWAASASGALLVSGWKPVVDFALAGVLGTGLYFGYSGRLWCRFACPLAALMHIYARFSRFRIVADGAKCISCNACTTSCHQGIDVMAFANRGAPMQDPECVRCSACVEVCPTGVLEFGRVDRSGRVVAFDRLAASAVVVRERSRTGARAASEAHGGAA